MGLLPSWRQAGRGLARRPGYTLTAILVLGLGVGAAATLFSVVDTVLLLPLPYPHADRLVSVLEANSSKHDQASLISPAQLQDWNQRSQTFALIAGAYAENDTDTSGAEPERLSALRVSPGYFQVYGAAPRLGRTFLPSEEQANGPGAAVISYEFWTRRFGRAPKAAGRRLVLGGVGYTIVGVMPRSFTSSAVDAWLPAQIPAALMRYRAARFYSGVGRLKPGVTTAQAQADLARVQAQLGREYPASDAGWSALVGDLKEARVGTFRSSLWLVFGAVLLLLLLGVANIGGLTLAQLQGRERELAIRSALGGGRARMVGGILQEAALVAAAGAVAGGGIAWLGVRAIATLAPGTLPRMQELHFDGRGWAFAAAISALAALGFGLEPALGATRSGGRSLAASLNASALIGRRWVQTVLVASQLALTVLLLASAGLLLRSYYNLSHIGGGFDASNVVTFHVGAGWNEDRGSIGAMQTQLLDRLQHLPGVEAAGDTNFLPASEATLQYQITLSGLPGAEANGTYAVGERTVTSGYLQALRVPLLEGAWCPPAGTNLNAPPKMMVNRSFVDSYLHGETIVGRALHFAQDPASAPAAQIVGVVGDVRENSLAVPATPFVYACLAAGAWPDPDYVVRTAGDAAAAMNSIRGVVRAVAPGRALFGLERLDTVVNASLEQPRLNARFLSLFAGFALLLAAVGLYSLISLMVEARRHEIGVRMALGARPAQVAGMVLAATGRTLAWGAGCGLLLAIAADRLLISQLYGVSPLDAPTLAGALLLLAVMAGAAAWLPAWRAAATDPAAVLRKS